jgi:thioredoxin-dependent peroxiredoxin
MTVLAKGTPAPDFTLPTDTGKSFTLSTNRGKSVLLYFYPQADTPACNDQNLDFTANSAAFAAKDIVLVGISPDTVKDLAKFRKTYRLSPILVSDHDHVAIDAYGVWGEKLNYGRTYMGLIRSTFLVGPDGKLKEVWRNIRAKGHVDRVLKAIG